MELRFESTDKISDDIINQIRFLVATPVGTVVCDRDFGINMDFVDKPTVVAETMFAAELYQKLARYIPSVKLDRVMFATNEYGDKIAAKLVIKSE